MISPEATEGLNGRVELVPAGTEVPITVRLVALAGSTANGGQLDFQIATRTLGLSRDGQLISQSIFPPHRLAGRRYRAVGGQCVSELCHVVRLSVLPVDRGVSGTRRGPGGGSGGERNDAHTRVILMGSRIQTILMEPISVTGIQAANDSTRD